MSMFMNVFVPVLYMAGMLLVVLFVLGLFMLMRNKISHQELTNERIAAETDLIHAFKARELIALDRDGVMLQRLQAKIERKYKNSLPVAGHVYKGNAEGPLTKQRDNSNSWEGNFKEFQPECGLKSESTDVPQGPLSAKTFYEGHVIDDELPNPKHTNTVFQGGDQFGRENNDPRATHPTGIENDPNRAHPDGMENAIKHELDHDDARYTPPQGPGPTKRKIFHSRYD